MRRRVLAALNGLVLAICGLAALTAGASPASAAATQSVDAFVSQWNGHYAKFDSVYGAQCVDLFDFYNRDVVGAPSKAFGNAYTIYGAASASYYAKHAAGSGYVPVKGDVAVWNSSAPGSGGAGHVAIVLGVVSASTISILTQNRGANDGPPSAGLTVDKDMNPTEIANHSTSYLTGYLHPLNLPDSGGGGGLSNGTFVSYGGNVYRMAGGAPLYVSSWSVFGGSQPTTALTSTQWSSLRSRPANGTDISAAGNGTVYRVVGGAPLVVTSCTIGTTNFCANAVPVDPYAISSLDHLNAVPGDGTDVALALGTGGTGSVYRFAGGAPLLGSSCMIGSTSFCGDAVAIDPYALTHLDHMNAVPVDGTDVALALGTGGTGSVYRFAGGAPLVASSCTIGSTNFCSDAVPIDPYALSHLDHMNAVPVDGTDVALALSTSGTGSVYRIAGGAPFVTSSCTVDGTAFCADTVAIDPYALSHLDHLYASPSADTLVQGVPSGQHWTFNGTCRTTTSVASGSVTVADAGISTYETCSAPEVSNTTLPAIVGAPQVGQKLTTSPGAWTPAASYAYQWLANGAAISGATASTYTPTGTDKGKRLSVRVTASKADYSDGHATSSQSEAVAAGIITNTAAPKITGTAKVAKTLTAAPGTWSPTGLTYKYQWLRDGTAISGATAKTYKLTSASKGHRVSVRVTASRVGYTTLSKTSAATAKVT